MVLCNLTISYCLFFFFQAEDGIRDSSVTGVQTCALPIYTAIAERRSGGCWRFCRACCSLANMAKTKKSKTPKRRKSKPKTHAKNRPSIRGGTPDPTNPKRVMAILEKLDQAYPQATCELKHSNPFQLVISTILSAQCTDVRVNQVTEMP